MKQLFRIFLSTTLLLALLASCYLPIALAQAPEESKPAMAEFNPVATGNQTQVHVSTVDELLDAIAPDTEIILDADSYDLSTAAGYGETSTEYYYWEEVFDGVQLTIRDLSNLTIRAEGDDIKAHTLSARPRYAHVLNFENCASITIEGFTAGHTFEPGSCVGGVLGVRGSQDILINHCGLYGCGVVGVWADMSKAIQVTNCDIYECSWGGIYMAGCRDVTFNGNTIRDLGEVIDGVRRGGTPFMLHDTTNITIDGKEMSDSYIGN